jgi:hypothetical protein
MATLAASTEIDVSTKLKLAETINGLYKAELIHRRAPWKTREAVELATLEWVVLVQSSSTARTAGLYPTSRS